MALSGIEIFKLLPKTNCGDCGVPTCLAFAMSLAAGKAELSKCPHVSQEAKSKLEEASAPPIRPVVIGTGANAVKTGGETVLFRHEKRFENPPGIAAVITDDSSDEEITARLTRFNSLHYERVGKHLRAELICAKCESNDAVKYTTLLKKIMDQSDAALILATGNTDIMEQALKITAAQKPLIYAATGDNLAQMAELAKTYNCPLAARGGNRQQLIELSEKLTAAGVKDIILDSGARTLKQAFEDQVVMRRGALTSKFKPLGFPTIVFPAEITHDPMKEALIASIFVAKYGGIIVLSDFRGESLFPLLVERMNIFTDPQRPLATTEGIYEIGGPGENSPVVLTSNFSLTYFIVSGEIEASRVPTYLLIKDTEGLSVMTAWAAGKFSADTISQFVKKCGIADKVSHRKIIIPGYIAAESGGLEEELDGWEIQIGPREAAHLPGYLREWK